MKDLSTQDIIKRIKPQLEKAKGKFTVSDASAATGLSLDNAKEGLKELISLYQCKLEVTEKGEVLYNFGSKLERRGKKSLKEIMSEVGAMLWRGFKIFFKVWITVMLVAYFVLYVLIMLALIIASSAGNRDNKNIRLPNFGVLFADLFMRSASNAAIIYAMDSHGYRYRTYNQRKWGEPQQLETKKRFVQSVYDFVFGPERPNIDHLENEKEVLAFLRENKGVLTTANLIALAGLSYEEAEIKFSEYLIKFQGEAEISEDGTLIAYFPNILSKGDSNLEGGEIELFWDEFEAPYVLTGNTTGKNLGIAAMNVFNLFFSLIFINASLVSASASEMAMEADNMLLLELTSDPAIISFATILGWIPFVFSALFFLVPIVRSIIYKILEKKRLHRNKLRLHYKAIFENINRDLSFSDLAHYLNSGKHSKQSENEIKNLIEKAMLLLQGEIELSKVGVPLFSFKRLRREIQTSTKVKSNLKIDSSLGKIIFNS